MGGIGAMVSPVLPIFGNAKSSRVRSKHRTHSRHRTPTVLAEQSANLLNAEAGSCGDPVIGHSARCEFVNGSSHFIVERYWKGRRDAEPSTGRAYQKRGSRSQALPRGEALWIPRVQAVPPGARRLGVSACSKFAAVSWVQAL